MKTGLLGRKLGHSYSPQIHAYFGDYSYELFEWEPEDVEDFLKNGDFQAINVTIPYKKTVMPYCRLTDTAKYMGSVNTIIRQPDGTLLGHNTDYFGFTSMVIRSGLSPKGKKVLVISRTGENNYHNLHLHADAAIICNTTPVGMYPNTGVSPINLDLFLRLEGVLDMIYNPTRTQLLMDADEKGLITCNGLWMLVAQAKEAAEWFLGQKLQDNLIADTYRNMQLQMENIILIGMPGCGKSTIGKQLAEATGKKFLDADEVLTETYGKSIPEIFAEEGEAGFRDKETAVLKELGKQSGLVIATGGGCITRKENYPLLHQNGRIFWLTRDLEELPTDGRPLSQANKLSDLYRVRKPLYASFADFIIENNTSPDICVREILRQLEEHS